MLIVEVTCRSLETILVKCLFNFMVQKVLNFTDDDLVDVGYKPVKPPSPQTKYISITKLKGLKHFSRLNGWGISFSLSPK